MDQKDISENQMASQQGVFLIVNRQMIQLTKPKTTLGRHLENDIVFHEEFLSRYHAEIVYEEGRYVLYDKDSTSGTFVNGKKIEKCFLNSGDLISFANINIMFVNNNSKIQVKSTGTTQNLRTPSDSREILPMDEERASVILVIDDEPSIRLGLTVSIKRHGYHVIEAVDGRDGLQKAKDYHPDLIVSDVMMPPPDGFELKRLLSTDPNLASIPFIFLTARSGTNDRIAGIRDGADDYISKPFVMEEVLARIDGLLRRVRTEQEHGRKQMMEIARQDMDKLRNEILQNFHHELRTPLMNILTPLELAVNNKYSEPEMQSIFIRMALSNADRLASLVSDITTLSNIDLENLNTIRQPINLNDHILGPINKCLEKYKNKSLIFTHQIVEGGDIKAPRREFTQSVVHLVDNAFKFSPQNGRVHLDIFTGPNGAIKIAISNEGHQISVEKREKVFEKFYQISQGDSREYEGLGVGLTIARAIFRSLGGDVRIVDSSNGCSIVAELPDIRPEDIVYG